MPVGAEKKSQATEECGSRQHSWNRHATDSLIKVSACFSETFKFQGVWYDILWKILGSKKKLVWTKKFKYLGLGVYGFADSGLAKVDKIYRLLKALKSL